MLEKKCKRTTGGDRQGGRLHIKSTAGRDVQQQKRAENQR